jgi:hypothetical protein
LKRVFMNRRGLFVLLLFGSVSYGQDTAVLEAARRTALNYTKSLPDFICSEVVHRYETLGTSAMPRQTDVLTLQLGYFQLRENYKLISRNGKPSNQSLETVGGAFSQGEFGSKLLLIFHPASKTEFEFKKMATIGARHVAVYSYRVERENSRFELRTGPESAIAGYHGDVYIDAESHLVLRIEETVDVPTGLPVEYSRNRTDYAFVKVAGHEVLLPARCESWAADIPPPVRPTARFNSTSNQIHYHNVIDFKDYRKYETESTLSFDKD